MGKGDLRVKRIYFGKDKNQFVIQKKTGNRWVKFGNGKFDFTYETKKEAEKVLALIVKLALSRDRKIKIHGVDVENLKTRV